ncbi:MAG TPA: NFACT family protein [Ktedonobacterales bacterium]|nr:NFACT family protein [Ktedonobacterales bacterium]
MSATPPVQLDALTLAALADELQSVLVGARVDDVIQPTPHSIALQLWGGGRNRWLIVSAHPQLARVHLTGEKPRKLAAEPPPFVMLLRKHLEGARLVAVRQPPWERVIELGFGRGAEAAAGAASSWLIAEIMGRYSNIILTDAERVILGALRLATAETNQYRVILPREPYRDPPPQTRALGDVTLPQIPSTDVTANDLLDAAKGALATRAANPEQARGGKARRAAAPPTVAGVVAAHVLGFGRELGREVAARALGDPGAQVEGVAPVGWEAVARETRALAALDAERAWTPMLVFAPDDGNDEGERPIAVTVYEPRQYSASYRRERVERVDDALARLYAGAEWRIELEQAKGDLRRILQTQRDRCLRKAEALRADQEALDEAQRLRREADALLAFQADVPPNARGVTLPDPWAHEDGATLTIALDPQYSAVENANRRYTRYHKLQRAAGLLPEQVETNATELARVEQLLTDLALAESAAEVSHVRAEVAEAGYIRGGAEARRLEKERRLKGGKKGKMGKGGKPIQPRAPDGGQPLRRQLSGGLIALVGKNSRQNEEITFHQAAPNDLWLHIRGAAGSHVILKTGGRPAPEEALREAAALAAWYSQLRSERDAQVDYTEARYVRHMKGGGPGLVTYERERAFRVAPADAGAPAK